MNILILSCGTRNKIVQYFKKELGQSGRVICTDCSAMAPALYEGDQHYIVPHITELNYIDTVLHICQMEQINGILSLIDPELSLLAQHTREFHELGILVIGSSFELCERSLNKYQMYLWLREHGYPCARSYIETREFFEAVKRGEIQYPVFIKPIGGSASNSIEKVYDVETVKLLFEHQDGLMIQEYLKGQEIGVDCYIDMISGELVRVFAKKKLVMRAGETDKGISFKDEKLFVLINRFVVESGWRGVIDIDLFDIDGTYYISEVNPRFGGGYPHAYECGCNFISCIVNNLNGIANVPALGKYKENITMMKYNEVMIRSTEHLE